MHYIRIQLKLSEEKIIFTSFGMDFQFPPGNWYCAISRATKCFYLLCLFLFLYDLLFLLGALGDAGKSVKFQMEIRDLALSPRDSFKNGFKMFLYSNIYWDFLKFTTLSYNLGLCARRSGSWTKLASLLF